ncbi:MAG: DUF86 domain-containing protein [Kiritimatiellales bacterium]|nr:DUF86 domain-containing protein [Kiritimatiellales bacterium]MCF7863580.1 DUF86 domain-containing protein [Kiritimatiellales bacterium]
MDNKLSDCLNDILVNATEVQAFIDGMSFKDYLADRKTQSAVERKFEIIGEALNRISRIDEEILEKIRDYRSIISFRNILAHGYDSIDERVVWGIIEADLDNLIADTAKLI